MKTINVMYWVNIVFAIACALFSNFIQATVFLAISSVFLAAELIIKELKR